MAISQRIYEKSLVYTLIIAQLHENAVVAVTMRATTDITTYPCGVVGRVIVCVSDKALADRLRDGGRLGVDLEFLVDVTDVVSHRVNTDE